MDAARIDSDSTLLERAQAGDATAFADLAFGLYPSLMNSALRVVRNHADAEEVVQEALLKAYVHFSQYRGEAALSTWLIRITVNQALMFLRKHRPEAAELDDSHFRTWQFWGCWSSAGRTPEEICASGEAEELVRSCLERIRPMYRIVLSLKAVEEKSHEEIAEQLEIPVELVRVRLHRARREMRRLLAGRVGPPAGE